MHCVASRRAAIPVSVGEQNPPEKKTHGEISFKKTKSGAGEQFLLLACSAKARTQGVFFHRNRYPHPHFECSLNLLILNLR